MEIKNLNNAEDVVSVKESDRKGHVYLKIGEGQRSSHTHLRPAEARAVAYALLSYAEQISN
jgi:hypothetical protein